MFLRDRNTAVLRLVDDKVLDVCPISYMRKFCSHKVVGFRTVVKSAKGSG